MPGVGWSFSPSGGPYWAIACADGLFPSSEAGARSELLEMFNTSPIALFVYSQRFKACTTWPTQNRLPETSFRSRVPTMVLWYRGGQPYKWALRASLLTGASSVTEYGSGETSDNCLERTITVFLETLTAEPDDC